MDNLFNKKGFIPLLLWVVTLCAMCSCTKVQPVGALKKPDTTPDTVNDIRKALNGFSTASLFAQAFNRAGMAQEVDPGSFYTIFAPTDSAMTAAGLTSTVISSLPIDSLKKIVRYHTTYGAVSDTTLSNAVISTQQNCLLDSSFYSASEGYRGYSHSLFVKIYGGRLSVNGWFLNNNAKALKASNGYIYTVNIVLRPPVQRLWDIIKSRPELSCYYTAINVIDSISQLNGAGGASRDSVLFYQVKYDGLNYDGSDAANVSVRPTVFAPTNTAFVKAGLRDEAAVRAYIISSMQTNVSLPPPYQDYTFNVPGEGPTVATASDGTTYISYGTHFFSIDSSLKMHYLFPGDQTGGYLSGAYGNLISYADLINCPIINNDVFNVSTLNSNSGYAYQVITPYTLRFTQAAGVLNIQWNSAGVDNANVYQDANQMQGKRNFWALNGVIYECDQLFYKK